jgi:TonB-linked SusC/RagA family outer membrane protein
MKKFTLRTASAGIRNEYHAVIPVLNLLVRITLFYLICLLSSVQSLMANSGRSQPPEEVMITLELKNETLEGAFKKIEKKTDYLFAYQPQLVAQYKNISLAKGNRTVSATLELILKGTELSFRQVNSNIVIFEKGKASQEGTDNGFIQTSKETFVKVITGRVTNEAGEPMAGVSVQVKGTTRVTMTNSDGVFSIEAPDDAKTLIFSYVGMLTEEKEIGSQSNIAIALKPLNKDLSEVVVVGYGTQKKVTVTGAVSQVKGSELEKVPALNLSNTLVGRLPGITAINSSGEPGYDGSSIRVRGTNSLGNTSALIVIDGVPNRAGGLERLNPADIESISVLKDASAAIYGSRAANGVILITTRRGKTGKPQLSYDFNQGWAQPTRIPKLADAIEYGTIRNELTVFENVPVNQWNAAWTALQTTGTYIRTDNGATVSSPVGFFPDDMTKYKDGSDIWGHPNTDWFGDALKKWAPQQRHNLQINGGSDNVRYLASLGYQNQDGYYKNSATGYKQYDVRVNLDAKINKYVNTSFGISAREEYRFFPTSSAGSIFRMLMRGKPNEPEIWPNGLPGRDIENGENPIVITTNQTGYDRDKRDYFQTNGKVEILIPGVLGLKVTGTAALDKYIFNGKRWQTPWYLYSWDKVSFETDGVTPKLTKELRSTFTDPRLSQNFESNLNINLSGQVNYDRTFGPHTVNFLVGVQKETLKDDFFNAYRRYYISTAIDQLFAGGDQEKNNGGGAYERARLSYFGRVGYNYKEKYIAEFLWRYDGSYIFPPDHRFGFFPGIMGGWRISEEDFFKNRVHFVDNLKLRASWGQMGAEPYFLGTTTLAEYQFLSTYGFSSYIVDDAIARGLYETRLPNPNFTWEVGNSTNFGLDASFLRNKLNLEFDYFINKRDKALIQQSGSIPTSAGISSLLPPVNLGRVSNKGFEFKLGYTDRKSALRYAVSVNGSYAKNKIIFWDEPAGVPDWQKSTGHPYGSSGSSFLMYQYDGVFRDQKEIDANSIDYSAVGGANLRPGDMKFKDINGDGKITGDDQVRLDKTRDPTFTGGLNITLQYKDFDCTILFQGATGGLLFIGTESGDIGNYLKYTYDHRWSIDNPSSTDPRVDNRDNTYYSGSGAGNNTYWLRSSDYLRFKNFEIGYNIPARIIKKASISNIRVYASGINLITWDKMKIWDPESTSSDGHYYPQARILNIGASVTF